MAFNNPIKRLGITDKVLYTWVSKFKKEDQSESSDLKAMQAEVAKLKAELRKNYFDTWRAAK